MLDKNLTISLYKSDYNFAGINWWHVANSGSYYGTNGCENEFTLYIVVYNIGAFRV